MGLLDDLRNQADSQRASEEEAAERKAQREQFYQEKMLPRMIKAYQFFNELAEHLNYIKMETIVKYPLLPDGAPQPLRQQNYKVVIDSSKAVKKVDFSTEGVLEKPVEFEIFGKDALLAHADRIERYSFRHERKDRKGPDGYVQSAKFLLVGPLPLKVTVEADIENSQFRVTVRNFSDPGFTKYNLSYEQFSDEFLDQIGKFVIRKEDRLFGKSEELSEEAKKQLRDRMIVEARIRQQELIEAEARRKAEEEAEKEQSAKEQIKRVVNTKVAKSKEGLKDMFNKLKKQAGFDSTPTQSNPASPSAAVPHQTPAVPPAAAKQSVPESAAPAAPATPVVGNEKQTPVQAPAAKPDMQAAQQTQRQQILAQHLKAPATTQTTAPAPQEKAAAKQAQPPKVYNAPSPNTNPFLTQEPPPEPPPESAEVPASQSAKEAGASEATQEQNRSVTTESPKADNAPRPNPFMSPDLIPEPIPEPQTEAAQQSAQSAQQPPVSELTLEETPSQATEPAEASNAPKPNPFMSPDSIPEPIPEPIAQPAQKPAAQTAKQTPVAESIQKNSTAGRKPSHESAAAPESTTESSPEPPLNPSLSPEALERDLMDIMQRDKPENSEQKSESETPIKTASTNPFLKPEVDAPAVSSQPNTESANETIAPNPFLKPGELNTGLSEEIELPQANESQEDKKSEATPSAVSSATNSPIQNPLLNPDELELDIDVSGNMMPPQDDKASDENK